MAYQALYRKWRPEDFGDVVGQDNIVKTLSNSLSSGRISHAYLFAGPRGTGKTSVARILAKGLNCQSGPTAVPCTNCSECQAIARGASLDVVEIDGASNRGIDDVRELRGQVQYTPINSRYKIYIIDEVHMLTPEAFNALLKTLEEPPSHVVFIFATTDPQRLPPTILSRVQRYDFQRLTQQAIVSRLEMVADHEGLNAQKEALQLIAEHAEGGMRDALSILEKCAAFSPKITVDALVEVLGIAPREQIKSFVHNILGNKGGEALKVIDDVYNNGRDLSQFVRSVVSELRRKILEPGSAKDESSALQGIEVLAEALREMRFAPDPRIPLEVAALKIAAGGPVGESPAMEDLTKKLSFLEGELNKLQKQLRDALGEASSQADPAAAAAPRLKRDLSGAEHSAFILDNWPEFLQRLRRERLVQCEAFLKEGSPVKVEGGNLFVAFPRDRGFHKASIEQQIHRESAERILAEVAGIQLHLKCVFQDELSGELQSDRSEKGEEERELASPSGAGNGERDAHQQFIDISLQTFGGKIFRRTEEE